MRTEQELQRLADETEKWLDELDPDDPTVTTDYDVAPLHRIAHAVDAAEAARRELTEAVHAARAAGKSWTVIAVALDVSRQAARQRFGGDPETRRSA